MWFRKKKRSVFERSAPRNRDKALALKLLTPKIPSMKKIFLSAIVIKAVGELLFELFSFQKVPL